MVPTQQQQYPRYGYCILFEIDWFLSAQKDWSFHYWKKFIEKDYGTGVQNGAPKTKDYGSFRLFWVK
jgi:hypothetical protein